MTTTAIIGFDTPLGRYWSGKRYFDCLINEDNYSLLRGRPFGHVVLVCPSLWTSPESAKSEPEQLAARFTALMAVLNETKIERLTYVTTLDLFTDDGTERDRVVPEDETSRQGILAGFYDFINLHFGRVVNLHVPELVGVEDDGTAWSVVDVLGAAQRAGRKPKVGLLTRHQLYPLPHIVKDAETAWECGLGAVNLVSEPVTTFELTERLFPDLVDSLPVAREKDPVGSARTSLYAIYFNDTIPHYIIDRESLFAEIKSLQSPV